MVRKLERTGRVWRGSSSGGLELGWLAGGAGVKDQQETRPLPAFTFEWKVLFFLPSPSVFFSFFDFFFSFLFLSCLLFSNRDHPAFQAALCAECDGKIAHLLPSWSSGREQPCLGLMRSAALHQKFWTLRDLQ